MCMPKECMGFIKTNEIVLILNLMLDLSKTLSRIVKIQK